MGDYKGIVLGNPNVGKTSLVIRMAENTFSQKPAEIDFKSKKIVLDDDTEVTLTISDTAGQERFRTLTSSYYRNADFVLVVFDITDQESWTDVAQWVEDGFRYSKDAMIYLIGNKKDLIDKEERAVSIKKAEDYAGEEELQKYFEVSVKTGEGIEDMFRELAKKVHEKLGESLMPKEQPLDLKKKKAATPSGKKKRCLI